MKSKFFLTVLVVSMLVVTLIGNAGIARAEAVCDPAFVSWSNNTITVHPTGINDTVNLQCAFDMAVASGAGARVQLTTGTFYTGQIVANGFQGTFAGNGAKYTVITNLPNLYVTPVTWEFYPPSPDNPWPILFNFVDGSFIFSDLAIHISGNDATTGWTIFGMDPIIELAAIVAVIGNEADAKFERVLFEGELKEDSVTGYSVINGIYFEGYVGEVPYPRLSGSFQVYSSTFRRIAYGTPVFNLEDASVAVSGNNYEDVVVAMDVSGINTSTVEFSSNRIVEAVIGFEVWDFNTPEFIGSTFIVKNNKVQGTIGIAFEQTFGEGNECLLLGNNVQNTMDIGIYLGPGTMGCTVIGGSNKTNVLDLGTDNILVGVNNMGTGVGPTIHHFMKLK